MGLCAGEPVQHRSKPPAYQGTKSIPPNCLGAPLSGSMI